MSIHLSVTHRKEDAESKWCPFSCTSDYEQSHKGQPMISGRQCLTTGCMAWVDETDHVYDIALGRCGLVHLTAN